MRSVSFVHPGDESQASYRYRAMVPAKQIGAKLNVPDTDIVVISKPWALDFAKQIKADGKTLVVDFCDDHFNHPAIGGLYREFAALADHCVAPTPVMASRIPHKSVAVIPDPYEFAEISPHADGDKLLWFGHNAGIRALDPYARHPNLTIVTGPKVKEGHVLYSQDSLVNEMVKANQAIFPTMKGHEYKSANRVINALRMGLYPICDDHPAYDEFKKMVWASDVRTGLQWATEFRRELNGLVRVGQDYIRDRYSPQTIGEQWASFLGSI
jgi:hypothetical protein